MGKIEQTIAENYQNPPLALTKQDSEYYPQDNEISLFDIWNLLVKQRMVIVGLTLVITTVSVLYALFTPAIYRSYIVLGPPTESDIQALVINGINSSRVIRGVKDISDLATGNINVVYAKFKHKLSARAVRRIVFIEMDLARKLNSDGKERTNESVAFNAFMKALSVSVSKATPGDTAEPVVTLSMEGKNPILIADIVKRLVEVAKQATAVELVADVKSKVHNKIKNIAMKINLLRLIAKRQRLDEIKRIEIAVALKKVIILDKLSLYRKLAKQQRLDKRESIQQRELQKKLLLLGHNRKIEQLKSRKSDDPFIRSLRAEESKLNSLKTIQFDLKTISVARLEAGSNQPAQRIKPRRSLIVILGIILGLIFGLFGAFIRNSIANARDDKRILESSV